MDKNNEINGLNVTAVRKINKDYILSAKSLGASQKKIFFKIILPACLPEIFTGIRTSIYHFSFC